MAEEQAEMEGFAPNPDRYRRLSEPFANKEEADAAVGKFFDGMERLREECALPEVIFAVAGAWVEDGEALDFIVPGQFGDAMRAEGYSAWLYGHMQAERAKLVARAISRGGRR